ncbi:MAG: MFS transporter [Chloroflexota bacterium]|nr:MFS transporter [Dehalococcoidia bacterium]MDW8254928.1 MFS transporter [Chloroflexota bacterium]
MPKIFRGWWVVAGGVGIQATLAGVLYQSYTAYVVPMTAEFGWSRTVFAGASSLSQIEFGITGPLQGWLLDRFGVRPIVRAGLVITALGLALLSFTHSIPWLYGSFLIASIGATLAGFVSITTAVVNWFERKRATALSIISTGISLGGVLVLVVAWGLTTIGWRATALASAVIVLIIGLPLAQLIDSSPEKYGLRPDGDPTPAPGAPPSAQSAGPAFTLSEAVRTPAFWYISLGQAAALLIVASMSVHLVPAVSQSLAVPLEVAASAVTITTVMSFVGQLVGGYVGDRFSKRAISALAMLGHAAGLLALAYATEFWMVVLFAILHGGAWGVRGPLMAAIRADYFGRAAFGKIFGVSNMIVTVGSVSGPLIAGYFADQTGDYRLGFTILALLSLLGCVFFGLAAKPKPPARRRAAPTRQPAPA